MAGLWYRAGTVAVTNASKKVVGTGTTWKSGASKPDKGHTVWAPDGKAYELDYVESDTVLYLVTAYSGVTASGMAYSIDISRSGSNSAFSRDLSAFVAYHQLQMDGWQQLLTGTGDVTLTAPDGTKLTVPSWEKVMNAGSGVVAMAKTEADRAKNEATKAAASATAAGDVVAASALPLPDVWAPLSDSLRLITGYGRDVLVGSDVVARMVNFSRNSTKIYRAKDGTLKVAAVNEPAFEVEGLLLEGPSTNLITASASPSRLDGYVQGGVVGAPLAGQSAKVFALTGAPSSLIRFNDAISLSVSDTKTASCFVMAIGSPMTVTIRCEGSVAKDFALPANEWVRLYVTRTIPTTGQYSNFLDVWIKGGSVGQKIAAWGAQLEALPFASSTILTDGAAVTRAGDIVTIPWSMNINPSAVTVALNYDLLGVGQANQRILEYAAQVNPRYLMQVTLAGEFESYCGSSALKVTDPPVGPGSLVVASTSPNRHALRLTGKNIATAAPTGPAGATANIAIGSAIAGSSPIYGHVRNLRIWHRALTDDQLKAVA
ncbi:LamG domain-containing protein [Aeromonas caviae]|uniref:phage head spike fiber domain-containing protein n=1 Tax=Aeromonas caviae TaxID=648 RepID=UPI001162E31C|nr:LamG domain-containing protein [Aeromonas caviae]QDO75097.1 LamG domain-containing protein [Aeromonas caviae]